ncbi:class I SAM-dependent methyltransferase [Streptomyces sp. OfavH-34-F]|uniref:class I SAM-dependent methyltransferase n=1 Tax=unclassified Streptomyces TaxID=2593676 RepID=UPI001EF2D9EC|nr:class I SAM-dependent methyltransferase [Streptomyces sp. OfavH-34-F]MCG7526713.1 class I SAM-dependent methyltransferase [Streptomyces sp. OfavH-34-F]
MEPQRPLYRNPGGYVRTMGLPFWGLHRQAAARACRALPQGGSVLDVGCGPGRLVRMVARRRPDARAEGVDPAAEMVEYAADRTPSRLRSRVEFTRAGAERLPFAEHSFDVVVSTMSFQHWHPLEDAIAEVLRVTRPSGKVFLYNVRGASYGRVREAAEAVAPGWSQSSRPVRTVSRPLLLFTHIELSRD